MAWRKLWNSPPRKYSETRFFSKWQGYFCLCCRNQLFGPRNVHRLLFSSDFNRQRKVWKQHVWQCLWLHKYEQLLVILYTGTRFLSKVLFPYFLVLCRFDWCKIYLLVNIFMTNSCFNIVVQQNQERKQGRPFCTEAYSHGSCSGKKFFPQ